jgi:hypothetical protein
MTRPCIPRFSLGQVVATPAALEALEQSGEPFQKFLTRHVVGDWGELDSEDVEANERALREDERLLSAYHTAKGEKLWIITEADRSVTTLLLPSDY